MSYASKKVGVFKPANEEPFAENNPRGYVPHHRGAAPSSSSSSSDASGGDGGGECLRQGIRPGELCHREVAVFLLDRDGFSSFP